MSVRARVIAIGQQSAGDDGVGPAVLAELQRRGVPAGIELLAVAEPTQLVPLLETAVPVVLIDAVVGAGQPGDVFELRPGQLAARGLRALSTHGVGVTEAIALAQTLAPRAVATSIWIVGVAIRAPTHYVQALSPDVLGAVPRAASAVLARVGG
jgi:hydrogenase maturation protease